MPTYEFYCNKCKKEFQVVASIRQYEEGRWICDVCHRHLRRLYSGVTIYIKRPEVFEKEARKWMYGEDYGKEW